MERNRFCSPVVWTAVTAQVLAVLVLVGVIGEEMSETLRQVIASLLQLLVLFGVLNNPTDMSGF